ncbi:gamma-glutamyltransferase [Demetria terragena]|uniref:gamma-glutamyltransferase n=1 Tax=Demetria terragena TaxID=63959 RepID=UPI00037BB5DC|nr:gamma-glutamyltransferase [Demetria terragena]
MPTAVAAPNALAAQAGVDVVARGGTAVDAALAAMSVTFVSEPGIVSAMGGAFITIWPAEGDPIVIDGNAEMPGRGLAPERFGQGIEQVWLNYAGGMNIQAGAGSVATPGAFAAMETAHSLYGRAAWADVLTSAIDVAEHGWQIGSAAGSYLQLVGDGLFTFDDESRRNLTRDGVPLGPGDSLSSAELADALRQIADEGSAALYRGDLGHRIADHIQQLGGLLTRTDLAAYAPLVRPATLTRIGDWQVATNPPPSIGGPVLATMLGLLDGTDASPQTLAEVQRRVLTYRRDQLDQATDLEGAGAELLQSLDALRLNRIPQSPNTAHVSAVDSEGTACAMTASAGYSSGVMVPGTGLLLNNSLGEPELNRHGLHALPPGSRLASNMAPAAARHDDGARLAIGSPGADRITTALQQTLAHLFVRGIGLQEAIDHPRLHLRVLDDDDVVVEYEPHADIESAIETLGWPSNSHEPVAMYFGGVGAAMVGAEGDLTAAGDPRRAAATAVG